MDNFLPHCPTSVTSDIFFYSLPALFNLFKAVFSSKVLFGISFNLLSVVLAISLTLFIIPQWSGGSLFPWKVILANLHVLPCVKLILLFLVLMGLIEIGRESKIS